MNKKGVSPLVATILLIVFSLILGTVTMNLGKAYIEDIVQLEPEQEVSEASLNYIDNYLYKCTEINPINKVCMTWIFVK